MTSSSIPKRANRGVRGVLRDLRSNTSGNTFMIIAFALIPVMGMAGMGVDMSRMYMAQSRLQQACDAGALAARRVMTTSSLSTTDIAEGEKFFNFNFPSGAYGTAAGATSVTYANITAGTPAVATGAISGTASTTMPMTIMSVVGQSSRQITANCSSKLEVGNTDVMMVLDTTGSMTASIPTGLAGGGNTTRIAALRKAVEGFYTALGPGSTRGRIRYGFVNYGRTVNVGGVLKNAGLMSHVIGGNADEYWDYDSKRDWFYTTTPTSSPECYRRFNNATCYTTLAAAQASSGSNISTGSSSNCSKFQSNTSFSGFTPHAAKLYDENAMTLTRKTFSAGSSSTNNCVRKEVSNIHAAHFEPGTGRTADEDRYDTYTVGVSPYVATLGTSTTVQNLSRRGESTAKFNNTWAGCVEERNGANTIANSTILNSESFTTLPTGAHDLDILNGGTTTETRWRPFWPEMVHSRTAAAANTSGAAPTDITAWLDSGGNSQCPTPARTLLEYASYTSAPTNDPNTTSFDESTMGSMKSYIDGLFHASGTIHDVGLAWGARIIAENGMFSSFNLRPANNFPIARHIIYMTDGQINAHQNQYTYGGLNKLSARISTVGGTTSIENVHDRRFRYLCEQVKAQNITLWVVVFDDDTGASYPQMEKCATTSTDHYFRAFDGNDINEHFGVIAQSIGALRITQ